MVDDDGAVLVPAAFLDLVLAEAPEQESMEAWSMSEAERSRAAAGPLPDERRDAGTLRRLQGG
ncbi:MAG: Dimethylmenaquinone methyltransferase [Xanthobacteraceae bacterium]|nr:Dimethylmenaquinone methyltransferase [Xanthobacteraceae bacterium]